MAVWLTVVGQILAVWGGCPRPKQSINADNLLSSAIPFPQQPRSVTLEPSSYLDSRPSSMSISYDGWTNSSSPLVLLQKFEWLPCICSFSSIPEWIGHLNKPCILKIGVRELMSNDVDVLRGLPALTVFLLYVRANPAERIVFTKTGFLVLFKFRCRVPLLEFEVDAMRNLLKLKLHLDAHGADQHGTIPVGIMHLTSLKETLQKLGAMVPVSQINDCEQVVCVFRPENC